MRASAALGHTGRPTAAWVPRCVARRDWKKRPRSAGVAVAKSTTRGWPARTLSPQPQYSSILPLGRSWSGSVVLSSPGSGAVPRVSFGLCSLSAGLRKPAGTLCWASASCGLLRVYSVTSTQRPGDIGLGLAEAVGARAAATEQAAQRGHRVAAAGTRHAHGHAHAAEGGHVDPGLRHRRLDDLGRLLRPGAGGQAGQRRGGDTHGR